MSDIGPGSIVQAVRESFDGSLTVGGLYVVTAIMSATDIECDHCNARLPPVTVDGKPERGSEVFSGSEVFRDKVGLFYRYGYCPCAFRKWPPPPSEILLSEDVDTDVKEPV